MVSLRIQIDHIIIHQEETQICTVKKKKSVDTINEKFISSFMSNKLYKGIRSCWT